MVNKKSLEEIYQHFYSANTELQDFLEVDFLGVNFSVDELVFKIYFTTEVSREQGYEYFYPLYNRNMIGALNMVKDTVNVGKIRFEAGLVNRTNDNMRFLYEWLGKIYPRLKSYSHQINEFSKLKCSTDIDYQLATMYFLGLIADKNVTHEVEAVKLHYILRMCPDTNHIGRNCHTDNDSVLSVIKTMDIPIMQRLGNFAERCLNDADAEMWIAAVDFYEHKPDKYKLYFKSVGKNIYSSLYRQLIHEGQEKLAVKVTEFQQWINIHTELKVYGLAVCCSENGLWSLNFYLDKNKEENNDV